MIASTQTNSPLAKAAGPAPIVEATARLKTAGLRITQPRLRILAVLVKRGLPVSIEQIHDDLGIRACDLVTVYRCVAAFEEVGIVRRTFLHNGTGLYTLCLDARTRYHLVDKIGQTVEELDAETSTLVRAALAEAEATLRARGYTNVSHIAEFFGTPSVVSRPASKLAPASAANR